MIRHKGKMKEKIECIHFDLDSVLYIPAEFLETTLLMSIRAMIQTGLKASPREALQKLIEIRSINSNAKDHFDRLCLHFNNEYDPIVIAAGIEKYWDCKIGIMTSAPEATPVLSALYHKYPLTIISNGPPLKQAGKIVRLGLGHFFSQYDVELEIEKHFFYSSSEKTELKPHPYLWLKSQKDIGYDFSQAIMVGDRYWNDIFGANRLGMITVKINMGRHADETIEEALEKEWQSEDMLDFFSKQHSKEEIIRLMKPDYTITSLRELEKIIPEIEKNL